MIGFLFSLAFIVGLLVWSTARLFGIDAALKLLQLLAVLLYFAVAFVTCFICWLVLDWWPWTVMLIVFDVVVFIRVWLWDWFCDWVLETASRNRR